MSQASSCSPTAACAEILWIGERSGDISAAALQAQKVTMTLSSVGDEVGDALAVLKNMHLAFRAERPQDHLSEYVVVRFNARSDWRQPHQ